MHLISAPQPNSQLARQRQAFDQGLGGDGHFAPGRERGDGGRGVPQSRGRSPRNHGCPGPHIPEALKSRGAHLETHFNEARPAANTLGQGLSSAVSIQRKMIGFFESNLPAVPKKPFFYRKSKKAASRYRSAVF